MSERFFRSNRPGYPHPVSSELENSGIRVAVGDCSVTERRLWRPPYPIGKTVHVYAKHYKHNEDGRTAPGVCGNGFVPLSHSGNVITRTGIYTHTPSSLHSFHPDPLEFRKQSTYFATNELPVPLPLKYFRRSQTCPFNSSTSCCESTFCFFQVQGTFGLFVLHLSHR